MEKVLLFGATGMAGHMVYYYLREMGGYDLANVVYRTPLTGDSLIVDVSDRNAVEEAVRQVEADILINCVGVLVRGSKEHPDNAVLLNAYFPHLLEKLADRYDARLIHISTDCVFSGKKGNYSETDFRDADDVYGRSKALGEIVNGRDLTIRTSIIGPELKADGEGLFHWLMSQHGTVSGFKTAIWGGVTTLELAKAISVAIKEGTTGLVHLSNGTGISKYDLLCLFKDIWGRKDVEIVSVDTNDVDKSIAKSARFGYEVPGYREMLKDLYAWMQAHKDMYRQYWER